MKVLIVLMFLLSASLFAKNQRNSHYKFESLELSEFSTDGCSAYPDGYFHTSEYEWLHCCFAHDIKYWKGGTKEEKVAADEELNKCVAEASFDWHGSTMELGVSVGGTPYLNTSWRWGYGWNHFLGFEKNDIESEKQIHQKAYSILDALSLQSHYLSEDQIEYILKSYQTFRTKNLERLKIP